MTEEEKAQSLFFKPLRDRAAIVAAGPISNYLFALVALSLLFMTAGRPFTPPVVGKVLEESAAATAGLQPSDEIVSIDGKKTSRFEDIRGRVSLNEGTPLRFSILRHGEPLDLTVTPQMVDLEDRFGFKTRVGRIGIMSDEGAVGYERLNPVKAVWAAGEETVTVTVGILKAVGQMVRGTRSAEELGGPIRIAQISGDTAQAGLAAMVSFMALLSINLGLLNFFPIPMLDGGHLLFYAIEGVRGKPLSEKAQEIGFKIGLTLVLMLGIFATWNDLSQLRVFKFLGHLVGM